jgi:hypothetical protein
LSRVVRLVWKRVPEHSTGYGYAMTQIIIQNWRQLERLSRYKIKQQESFNHDCKASRMMVNR